MQQRPKSIGKEVENGKMRVVVLVQSDFYLASQKYMFIM